MKAILTDTTKCIGCRECVVACKKANGLEPEIPRRWLLNDGLSARNWTTILERTGVFVRKQCRHCIEPACASVCPVGALRRTDWGAVIYDAGRCMGCRYCMMSCPYGIPRYDWEHRVPTVRKCQFCHERVEQGGVPACTESCPTGATIFGEREELLAEAHHRIRKHSELYRPVVWGETEVGGTAVLYISDQDLSFLTQGRQLPDTPLPRLTAPAMRSVPFTFLGVGVFMVSLHWVIRRRQRRQSESGGEEIDRV